MIIFEESLTKVVKTKYGYEITSPLYSFNSNVIPEPLNIETITDFIIECRRDRLDKIGADLTDFLTELDK